LYILDAIVLKFLPPKCIEMRSINFHKLLFCSFIFLSQISKAQDSKSFVVKPGMSVSEVLLPQEIFRYPTFKEGIVMMKNGRPAKGNMNFNYLAREMQFLNRGDTLALSQEDQINYIAIGTDTFFYNKGYLEKLATTPDFTLVKRTYFKDLHKKMGGYGQASATAAITSYSSIAINNKSYDLKVAEELELVKSTDYLLLDKEGNLIPADKKNLLKLTSHKDKVNEYIKDRQVRFTNEKDLVTLVNLMAAVNELPKK